MDQPLLGRLIPPGTNPGRDAVHVAVAPAVAGVVLAPGDHVGVGSDGRAYRHAVNRVGIVDPFLQTDVLPGQQFYLFLYPGTVTSLRHVWTHPAFRVTTPASGGGQ